MKKLFPFFITILWLNAASAQINIGGKPYSFQNDIAEKKPIPSIGMSPLNISEIEKDDQKDDQAGLPPRFGYPFEVNINLENSGTWTTLDNGDRVWRLTISSPGALSINLTYDAFWLPNGATLYIYNENQSQVIGGFTSQNNNSPKGQSIGFATGFIFSDQITLEYYEPQEATGQGEISIDQIVHGYRLIRVPESSDFGTSGDCQVNINCSPEGDSWQAVKHSVAMIIVGGTRWCTGSLLITTVGDFKPYFLTADHCLTGTLDAATDPMAGNWMFVWEYESAGCADGTTEPTLITTSGAILVANNDNSDFALFRLIEDPLDLSPSVPLWYNGWDATGGTGTTGGVGIHHPDGDIKKISTHNMDPTSSDYDGLAGPDTHWRVLWDATTNGHSVTEGGSSGSPLLNNDQRVTGQLHGGAFTNPNCSIPEDDDAMYGKFSVSWDGDNSRRRLHDWLDPDCPANQVINTNFTLGGHVFYASNEITSTSNISGNTLVDFNAGQQIRLLPGFRAEPGVFFHAQIRSCAPTNKEMEDAKSLGLIVGAGTYVLPGEHSGSAAVETRSDLSKSEEGFQCYPNPFSDGFAVRFEIPASSLVSLSLSDAFGRQIHQPFTQKTFNAGEYTIQMENLQLPPGIYYVELKTPFARWVQKVVKVGQ